MSLVLRSTTPGLKERLEKLWEDGMINNVEHLKLRRESDQAVADLKNVDAFSKELEAVQLHADKLISACINLSKAVYVQNIVSHKGGTTEADLADRPVEQDERAHALEGSPEGVSDKVAALQKAAYLFETDDRQKQPMQQYRGALMQAIEYQIAYVVAGAEATIGKLKI
jgi:hypothetical protein